MNFSIPPEVEFALRLVPVLGVTFAAEEEEEVFPFSVFDLAEEEEEDFLDVFGLSPSSSSFFAFLRAYA